MTTENQPKRYRLLKEYPCLNPEPYILPSGLIYEWDGTKYSNQETNSWFFKEMVEGLSKWFELIPAPASEQPANEQKPDEIPQWYTEQQMYDWLIHNNYSKAIATELAKSWASHLQGAYKKGWEMGRNKDREPEDPYEYLTNEQKYFMWTDELVKEFAFECVDKPEVGDSISIPNYLKQFKQSSQLPPTGRRKTRRGNEDYSKRPPLGVMPEWRWKELRVQELREALIRYADSMKELPQEWINEKYELQKWLQFRQPDRETLNKLFAGYKQAKKIGDNAAEKYLNEHPELKGQIPIEPWPESKRIEVIGVKFNGISRSSFYVGLNESIMEERFHAIKQAIERVLNNEFGEEVYISVKSMKGGMSPEAQAAFLRDFYHHDNIILYTQADIDRAIQEAFNAAKLYDDRRGWGYKFNSVNDYIKSLK